MPDTAQTLAVVALFAEGETVIRGLHTLRVKETDRVRALAKELEEARRNDRSHRRRSGDPAPKQAASSPHSETYEDHRMAMSFSLAATKSADIVILNSECVNKTYPHYFEDLGKLTKSA